MWRSLNLIPHKLRTISWQNLYFWRNSSDPTYKTLYLYTDESVSGLFYVIDNIENTLIFSEYLNGSIDEILC